MAGHQRNISSLN